MTLATRIIPVLLHRGYSLYKGEKFNSWRQVGHAMQSVRIHQARGVDELILLDIDATPKGRGPDLKMIEELSSECFMPLTVGGGIRSFDDVKELFNAGADRIAVCTGAFPSGEVVKEITNHFGNQAVVAAIDVDHGMVVSHCGKKIWKEMDGDLTACQWATLLAECGAGEILLTSVEREGTMEGYDLDLIREVSQAVTVPVIANGGCGTYEHMYEAIKAGASAVAAGAMFQFTDQTPQGAAKYLASKGIEVRL